MHDPVGPDDLGPEGVADALVTETDPEQRNRRREAFDDRVGDPASSGVQGPGEMMIWVGRFASISSSVIWSLRTTSKSRLGSISPDAERGCM